jgi:hypothetical protein
MSSRRFIPQPIQCYGWSGAASGELEPGKEAVAIGARFHGAWLTAYMIRRFGPPNSPSDDYKNLCSWTITTPMPGLALLVTPYIGDGGDDSSMSLHFGYRWSAKLEKEVGSHDPGARECRALGETIWNWQRGRFVLLYTTDGGDRKLVKTLKSAKESEPDVGLYWASPSGEKRGAFLTKKWFRAHWAIVDAIVAEYSKVYPRKPQKKPANGRWPTSRIARSCNFALRAAIRALMEPIWVRDLCFYATTGYLPEGCPSRQRSSEQFEFAGYACKVDK